MVVGGGCFEMSSATLKVFHMARIAFLDRVTFSPLPDKCWLQLTRLKQMAQKTRTVTIVLYSCFNGSPSSSASHTLSRRSPLVAAGRNRGMHRRAILIQSVRRPRLQREHSWIRRPRLGQAKLGGAEPPQPCRPSTQGRVRQRPQRGLAIDIPRGFHGRSILHSRQTRQPPSCNGQGRRPSVALGLFRPGPTPSHCALLGIYASYPIGLGVVTR